MMGSMHLWTKTEHTYQNLHTHQDTPSYVQDVREFELYNGFVWNPWFCCGSVLLFSKRSLCSLSSILIYIPTALYYFLYFYSFKEQPQHSVDIMLVVVSILFMTSIWCEIKVLSSDPGFLPPQIKQRILQLQDLDLIPTRQKKLTPCNWTIVSSQFTSSVKACTRCNVFMSEKISHCESCGICILNRCYHSTILNICITSRNSIKYCCFNMALLAEGFLLLCRTILHLTSSPSTLTPEWAVLMILAFTGQGDPILKQIPNILRRMKASLLDCCFTHRLGYLLPNRVLSLDLRELILKTRSVHGVYRCLSMSSDRSEKAQLIDEIFRSSSTLSGIDDRNQLLLDCIQEKNSENQEENNNIQDIKAPFSLQFRSISEILAQNGGADDDDEEDLSRQSKQSTKKQEQQQQRKIDDYDIEALGPCICDREYFSNPQNQGRQQQTNPSIICPTPINMESSVNLQRTSFCKSPTSGCEWRNNASSHYMLERLSSQQITFTSKIDQEEMRYQLKETKQTEFYVDDQGSNLHAQNGEINDNDDMDFSSKLNTIHNQITRCSMKKKNSSNKAFASRNKGIKQKVFQKQIKELSGQETALPGGSQANQLADSGSLEQWDVGSLIIMKWDPLEQKALNSKGINENHNSNLQTMHSQENNSNGLHTFGDDLDKGHAHNIQSRFRELNCIDPSNIDDDLSQEIERDWDNRISNENSKVDNEDKSNCGVIKDCRQEIQTKSSEENIVKSEKQIKSQNLSIYVENDSRQFQRNADTFAEFNDKETTRQLAF